MVATGLELGFAGSTVGSVRSARPTLQGSARALKNVELVFYQCSQVDQRRFLDIVRRVVAVLLSRLSVVRFHQLRVFGGDLPSHFHGPSQTLLGDLQVDRCFLPRFFCLSQLRNQICRMPLLLLRCLLCTLPRLLRDFEFDLQYLHLVLLLCNGSRHYLCSRGDDLFFLLALLRKFLSF